MLLHKPMAQEDLKMRTRDDVGTKSDDVMTLAEFTPFSITTQRYQATINNQQRSARNETQQDLKQNVLPVVLENRNC